MNHRSDTKSVYMRYPTGRRATEGPMLTTHAMAGNRDRALAAGCDDCDTMPIEFERLLDTIEALHTRGAAA